MTTNHTAHTVKWLHAIIVHLVLLLLVPIQACAPLLPNSGGRPLVHFVATSGSDVNAGNEATPWATLQKAADAAKPGDTVTISEGNYDERVTISHSGTEDAPIVFQASGRVTMRGFMVEADYITIKGFEILNTPSADREGVGILVQGSYCDLEDNYIHDISWQGILLFAPPSDYAQTTGCVVRHNRIERAAQSGLDIRGNNHLVEGNDISGTRQYPPGLANPPSYADADGIRFFGAGHTIRGNNIHDIPMQSAENRDPHVDCFQTWEDKNHVRSTDTILEQNQCSNIQAVTQNTSDLGSGFQVQAAQRLTIRNNIVRTYVGLLLYSSSAVDVFNNDFLSSLAIDPRWDPVGAGIHDSSSVLIQNNIFLDQVSQVIIVNNSGVHGDHNLEYRSDSETLFSTRTYDHSEDLWGVDPLFANAPAGDFHLLPGSPAIGGGITLNNVMVDFEGKPRVPDRPFDIGAFSFAAQ